MTGEVGESSKLSPTVVLTAALCSTLLVLFIMCNTILKDFVDKNDTNINTLGYQTVYSLGAFPNGVSAPTIYKAIIEANGAVNNVYLDGNLLYSFADSTSGDLMILTTKYANKVYLVKCQESSFGKYMLDVYLTEVVN